MLKKRKKKIYNYPAWTKFALAAGFILGTSSALVPEASWAAIDEAYNDDVKLELTNLNVQIKDTPITTVPGAKNTDGDTYIGLEFLNKQLGLITSWDVKAKKISVSSSMKTMTMSNQNSVYDLNGHRFYGTLHPVIVDGAAFLPLRYLLENMGYSVGYRSEDNMISIHAVQENALQLTNVSSDLSQGEEAITIQYPQMEGWSNKEASVKINAFIKEEVNKFKIDAEEQLKQFKSEPFVQSGNIHFTYDVNYTVTYNEQNKLSLHFDLYQFTGGAHGMSDKQSHTFDLTTGEPIYLKQAALNNASYKQIINDEIKKQIQERQYVLLKPFETIRDDQGFYLKDDTLVVYFDLYEYTPYVLGIPEFQFPLSSFKTK